MTTPAYMLSAWAAEPAHQGSEGIAFVIYPDSTSEPLAEVLARDGADEIARRMAAAPKALELLQRYVDMDIATDTGRGNHLLRASGLHREAVALIAKATGGAACL